MNPESIYPEIGDRIRIRRRRLKMNQEQLANRIGISRASLANMEVGRQKILVHQLYAIAVALALPPADLIPSLPDQVEVDALPLPADLKPVQREQIARLLSLPQPDQASAKDVTNATKTKR